MTQRRSKFRRNRDVGGFLQRVIQGVRPSLQPIMPLDLPVKVRSWELAVYLRIHIRR